MSRYQKAKENVRRSAIQWQADFASGCYYYEDLDFFTGMYRKLARRYGLVKEFEMNGII